MPTSPPHPSSDRARLAAKLREIRATTGLSGNQFAKTLGWPQSRVSKIETAAQFPTGEDITNWLTAADAVGEEDAVTELLKRARVESVSSRQEFEKPGGAAAKQRSILRLERQASRVASFQPALVPGLVQTPGFMRKLLALPSGPGRTGGASEADIEQMVAVRIERQAVLHDPNKAFPLVIGEAALWTRIGDLETQLGQLDRLHTLAGLRTVDLRILPFDHVIPIAPLHGFSIHDDDLVVVELFAGEQLIRDPEEIALYEHMFSLLRAEAVSGASAARLIQDVSRQLASDT
ncbi:helix-turn-helix domain-containing protein [Amycolatopsis azurea]|uniref:Putative regulatory protein n=1 Tax=Amycolatopsis azurea DSM 43854 TaxID=1238180 RepID=M2QAH9_9PSEU|nr:helix-turn-helix transcriptional regulator [Amycolatopsis azurea]EMD23756.1 putative regulatory protein [Amycolatopsis azurea DSM 43854]OOC02477.1 transcriptional regulator [Amycolatopsis azurea DSM 43854]